MGKRLTAIATGVCIGTTVLSLYEQYKADKYKEMYREKSKQCDAIKSENIKLRKSREEGLKNGQQLCDAAEQIYNDVAGMHMALRTIQTFANQAMDKEHEPSFNVKTVDELAFAVKAQADYILDYVDRKEKERHGTDKQPEDADHGAVR